MARGKIKSKKEDDKEYQKQLKIFRERFNKEYKKLNTSQKAFASDTDISASSISKYLNGEMLPNTRNLEKMAKVLNVSGHYLLGKEEAPNYKYEDIIRETGLSQKAFEILKVVKHTELMKTINFLIEQEEINLMEGFSPIIKEGMTQKEYEKAFIEAEKSYTEQFEKILNRCIPLLSTIHNYLSIKANKDDIYIMPNGSLKKIEDLKIKFDRHFATETVNTKEIIEKTFLEKIENELKSCKKIIEEEANKN